MLLRRKYDKSESENLEEMTDIDHLLVQLRIASKEHDIENIKIEIIEKLLYLCKQISNRYIIMYDRNHLRNDIVQAATLGLVKAVSIIRTKLKDNNIMGLITMRIHGEIINLLRKEFKLYSKRILQGACKKSEIINHDLKIYEITEMLNSVIQTDIENKIIELRKEKYNSLQIAKELGISVSSVRIAIKKVFKRLKRVYGKNVLQELVSK